MKRAWKPIIAGLAAILICFTSSVTLVSCKDKSAAETDMTAPETTEIEPDNTAVPETQPATDTVPGVTGGGGEEQIP